MPVCFQLYPHNSDVPAKLQKVDDDMSRHFGQEPDERLYFRGWYDVIGLRLALGDRKEQLLEEFKDHEIYGKIVEWIFDNFRVESFREVR